MSTRPSEVYYLDNKDSEMRGEAFWENARTECDVDLAVRPLVKGGAG